MGVEENLLLMQTLDNAWNDKDWETFMKRHSENVSVYWPGQPEPTRGRQAHHNESVEFFKAFDNRLDNNPYKILFGYSDYTCSVARWTGKNIGPFMGPDGRMIPATNKKFELEFCTVAHWKNNEIVAEKLFYDLVGLLNQLGVTLEAKIQAEKVPAVQEIRRLDSPHPSEAD